MSNSISIRLLDAEQLLVTIGEERRVGHLYYLGLDPESRHEECSVASGLRRLIETWIEVVLEAKPGALFYLPFDFSDEFTRWVACQKSQYTIDCVFGWAPVEGWAFSPADFRQYAAELQDFQPDEPVHPQTVYLPRFLSGLRQSCSNLPCG